LTVERTFALSGAVSALIAVAAGAFGAHALRTRVSPEAVQVFETGARYQMYHALALFAAAWVAGRWAPAQATWAGCFFLAGTVIFSGSLYLLTFTGIRWLGAVTPLGGLSFLLGWVSLAWAMVAARD
jgi:uncharacterized membrane protein YgdD (TMEM256/DUF423 family)